MTGSSTKEEPERRYKCKSSSKDNFSTDYGRQNGNQTRHSWRHSESVASWRSSWQEQNGVPEKWRDSKLSKGGCEVSTLKSQGPKHSLLSKCNDPYRPPCFYQARSRSYNNETSASAETPNKERVREETWRKASSESMRNDQSKAIQQKHKSSPNDQKEKSDESSCSVFETAEKYHSKKSLANHSLLQVKKLPFKSKLIRQEGTLEELILEADQFSALLNLEKAEDVDPGFVDKANFAACDSSRKYKSATVTSADFDVLKKEVTETYVDSFAEKKETKADNIVSINSIEKTDINSSELEVYISLGSDVKSSQNASNSSEAFLAQEPKGVNIAERKKTKANSIVSIGSKEKTDINSSEVEVSVSAGSEVKSSQRASNLSEDFQAQEPKSVSIAGEELKINTVLSSSSLHLTEREKLVVVLVMEIGQSPNCIELYDMIVEGRDSCRSQSKFIPWFSDNAMSHAQDKASSDIDQIIKKDKESSTGMSMKENRIDQELSKEPSLHGQKTSLSVATKIDVSDCNKSRTSTESNPLPLMSSQNYDQVIESVFGVVPQTTEASNLNPVFDLHEEEADSDIEIHLPDEESLITVEDTCISSEQAPSNIPTIGAGNLLYAGSNNLLASETLHQYSNWQTWLRESQMNSQQPYINLADPRVYPPTLQDSLIAYQDAYNPVNDPRHYAQIPVEPRGYEPSTQHFVSPGVQMAQNFSPYYNKLVSPQLAIHPQVQQIPYFQ